MTPQPETARVRHGQPFYFLIGLFALLAGSGFTYGMVGAQDSLQRLAEAAMAIIFLAGALQAGNRLLRPQAAWETARNLPDSTRQWLRGIRTALVGLAWLGFVAGALMHFSQSDSVSGAGSDMQVFAAVLVFLAWCFADFCGEPLRLFARRSL